MTAHDSITPTTKILGVNGHDVAWMYVIFRPVPGFDGYLVGSNGTLWSKRLRGIHHRKFNRHWRRLRTRNGGPYARPTLCDGVKQHPRMLHRIVLTTFLGPPKVDQFGLHFPDRDTFNNSIANLRWGTRSENEADSVDQGTRIRGEGRPAAKLTDQDVREIRRLKAAGMTGRQIGEMYGMNRNTINTIAAGKAWAHVI